MIVEAGPQRFHLETVNLSPFGAKVRSAGPTLEPGTKVHLHFRPPDQGVLRVQAFVWRTDPDGLAFFFVGIDERAFNFPIGEPPG